nr:hypothetical protein [Deltaproteobacteria bacterium]
MRSTGIWERVGQHAPPASGYSIACFEGYLEEMAKRLETFRSNRDHRAVFELTYLVFSQQVLEALKAKRFEDMAWATDMACRFVDVYHQQLERWDRRDPYLCRAWRVAFEAMEDGRLHVLQAMLLAINAHIHYDLAFVTLGASRHCGDLSASRHAGMSSVALSLSALTTLERTGVPTVRYRDFLVINQLEWEAIAKIQDVVLQENSPLLYWGNRLTLRATRYFGQRLLMDARDSSWYQTMLLIHARNDRERDIVTRLIDAYASSMADLIQMMSVMPHQVVEHAVSWFRRGERIDPELQAGLTDLACSNATIADLVLRELAFGGADAISVTFALLEKKESRLAGVFGRMALAHAPRQRRQRFVRFLERGTPQAIVTTEAMLAAGVSPKLLPPAPLAELRARWTAQLERNAACSVAVADHQVLVEALSDYANTVRVELARLGVAKERDRPVPTDSLTMRGDATAAYLRDHPDPWIRRCAARAGFDVAGGVAMSSVIERVLFLKDTQIFMEVDM